MANNTAKRARTAPVTATVQSTTTAAPCSIAPVAVLASNMAPAVAPQHNPQVTAAAQPAPATAPQAPVVAAAVGTKYTNSNPRRNGSVPLHVTLAGMVAQGAPLHAVITATLGAKAHMVVGINNAGAPKSTGNSTVAGVLYSATQANVGNTLAVMVAHALQAGFASTRVPAQYAGSLAYCTALANGGTPCACAATHAHHASNVAQWLRGYVTGTACAKNVRMGYGFCTLRG